MNSFKEQLYVSFSIVVGIAVFYANDSFFKGLIFGVIATVIVMVICLVFSGVIESNHTDNADKNLTLKAKEKKTLQLYSIIDSHLDVLLLKRRNGIINDEYGFTDDSTWLKEFDKFLIKICMNEEDSKTAGLKYIKRKAEALNTGKSNETQQFSNDMNGIDYEHFCAEILQKNGWETSVSKASGDQGVDIIAKKNNIKIAVQCKRHSKPVGNKAVQEVVAGRTFYGTDKAIVVTNNNFTKSARELAQANDVLLMQHEQLATL